MQEDHPSPPQGATRPPRRRLFTFAKRASSSRKTACRQREAPIGIGDPIERLRKIGHAYVAFGLESPNHYRLMFMTPHPPIGKSEAEEARRGNPEEDAYAFLKATVADGVAQKRFRPELTDVDLLAQTVWSGTHGVVSLHIAKCNDDWVDWRPVQKTATLIIDAMIRGLTRPRER